MFEKFAEDVVTRCIEKLAFLANKYNFAHGTSSLFSRTKKRPDRKPDKLSPKKGSDSEYWITPSGVIRGSDHWGTVGSCSWDLAGSPDHPGKKVYGFSPWENFEKKAESRLDRYIKKPVHIGYNKSPAGRPIDLLGQMDYAPIGEFKTVDFNQILQLGRKTPQINNPVKENDIISIIKPGTFSKPIDMNQAISYGNPRKLLDTLLHKRIRGFNKTASKKVLEGYYDMSPEEQEAARNALKDNETIYLSSKPIGRGYEGSAYRVLTKDLGEAIRKNFNGCYGETPHIDRMIELKGDAIDKVVRDLVAQNKYQEAHDLYIGENPRRDISKRLEPRLQVFRNSSNQEFLAALAKAQPRRVHENIGGGIRGDDLIYGGVIMEKLRVPDSSSGFTEADFAAMNSDLANKILKAHASTKPAFGTDFPEEFRTPNGEIGPNMRFAPILRGADGKLYQVKDLRNVFDPSILPEKFRGHETAFHNIGIDNNGKLKFFDFGAGEIEE